MQFTNKASFAVFKHRDFNFFISAKSLITSSLYMQAVAIAWQVYDMTKDPLALGYSGLAEAAPAIAIALIGGHVADKVDRRLILLFTTFTLLLGASFLLLSSLPGFNVPVMALYGIIGLTGLARGFYGPANFALMSQLVPRHLYVFASTWNSTFWHLAAVLGATIGGLVTGFAGLTVTYALIIMQLITAWVLFSSIKRRPVPPSEKSEGIIQSLGVGIGFVFNNKIVFGALLVDMLAVLFGGAVALLPMFADVVLNTGPEGLGVLRASQGIGAFLNALWLAYRPPVKDAGQKMLVNVAAYSACMVLFALSTNFWLSVFILALSGAFDNVSVVIRSTLLQLNTPDDMRGRVSAVNSIFINSSNEIGAFESGLAAKLMGLIPSVIFGGFVSMLSVIAVGASNKKLRNAELTEDKK